MNPFTKALLALAVLAGLVVLPAVQADAAATRDSYNQLYTQETRADVQAALGSNGWAVFRRDEGTWMFVRKVYPTSRPGVWVSVMYLQIRSLGEAEPWLAEKSWSRLGARPGW